MLKGKFRDRTHLACGYSLWKVRPNIEWFETGYFARCPRCLVYLPVDVDPDSIPRPKFKPKPMHRRTFEPEPAPEE